MTGKVFKESSNIYEDEARVLFDYYKKAAEKIVEEEIDVEHKIEEAINNKNNSSANQKKAKILMIVLFSLAGVCAIVSFLVDSPLILVLAAACLTGAIVNLVKKNKAKKAFENFGEIIAGLEQQKTDIRRDYKVSKLGVAYVPVATRIPFEGKSFVVDHTKSVPNMMFSLPVLHQPQALQDSLASLERNLNNIPVVEGNVDAEQIDTSSYSKSVQNVTMHDYMGTIDREVRNISYLLTDSETQSVSLPVITPQSANEEFLEEFATAETGNKPVVKVFDTDGFDSKIETFSNISKLKKQLEKNSDGGSTNYFKSLIKRLGDSVQLVSKIKTSSACGLLEYTNSILAAVLKAGYNQYSPQLEAEELARIRETNFNYQDCVESYKPFELKESSKVKYDIYNQNWVAEDNTRTNMPFGINQIEEEVLMPLINNLMMETRVERLKIYNNIKDQKISYLNKWHQDVEAAFRDNRKSGQDLITQITNAYAEYSTAHNTYISYKETQEAMKVTGRADIETKEVADSGDSIKEIEEKVEKCKEIGDAFQIYMRNLQSDINASSEKFGFVEYFEGSLRDGESKKVADSIVPENLENLDPRRRKIVPINSYFATYADLPPEPSVEPKLMDDFSLDLQQVAASHIQNISELEKTPVAEEPAESPAQPDEPDVQSEAVTEPAEESAVQAKMPAAPVDEEPLEPESDAQPEEVHEVEDDAQSEETDADSFENNGEEQ